MLLMQISPFALRKSRLMLWFMCCFLSNVIDMLCEPLIARLESGRQPSSRIVSGEIALPVPENGQMVEAGDPVSVSAIRTSNSGMGFHGFYRPTE